MYTCVAQAADVFGTGLVAGAFVIGTFAVHPAAGSLEASSHLMLRQELIRRLSIFMPPIVLLPILAASVALGTCQKAVAWSFDTLGLGLSLATVVITVAVNAPLNRRFMTWSPATLPQDWRSYVGRWNAAHTARMTTAVAAFICAILAGS